MKRVGKLCWTTAAAVLLLGMLGTGAMAYSGGSGAQGDPYRIADLEDLKELRDAVNGGEEYRDVCFLLTRDIELDCDGRAAAQWTPIGTYSRERHPFRGVFDGGGHVISNLYISRYYEDHQGLFGYIEDGTVRNLGVVGSISFKSGYSGGVTGEDHSAGIVGESNKGTVENCWYAGKAGGGGSCVGGIVGYNKKGTVKDCYVMSAAELAASYGIPTEKETLIRGQRSVGGVVGENEDGTVTDCYCHADSILVENAGEDDAYRIGGVVGYNTTGGRVENCHNTATIGYQQARIDAVGGVVGSNTGKVLGCYNTGKVYSTGRTSAEAWGSEVGGVVGSNGDYETALVENCYNTGRVTGAGMNIGGIVGYNDTRARVRSCRNEGLVLGTTFWTTCMSQRIGGIAGSNSGSIEDCRNEGRVKNESKAGYRFGAATGGVVGYNLGGKVRRCCNTGAVLSTHEYVGGIVGDMNWGGPVVEDCWNSGSVTAAYVAGGIAGNGRGQVRRCVNLGPVSITAESAAAQKQMGGVVGRQASDPTGFESPVEIEGSFYLDTTAAGGFQGEDLEGKAERRTAGQLASGEIAWLLQGDREDLVWGQDLGTDSHPILAKTEKERVRKLSFRVFEEGEAVSFAALWANEGKPLAKKDFPMPEYEEPWDFYHWSRTADVDGEAFEKTSPVDGDLELYAVFRECWNCDPEELSVVYGEELTQDLSEFLLYEGFTDETGRFLWTIEGGNEDLGASLSGDILTIPATAEMGDYELLLCLEEQGPMVTLDKDQDPQPAKNWEPDPLEISLYVYVEPPEGTKMEERPTADIYFDTEELGLYGGTYLINGREVTLSETCSYWPIPEEYLGTTVSIVRKARDESYVDSVAQNLVIPARPLPPTGVTAVDATGPEEGDGKLTGLREGMQYQLPGEEEWNSADWEEIPWLEPGVYGVRFDYTLESFVSEAIRLTIGVTEPDPVPEETPSIGIDYGEELLTGFDLFLEYEINGEEVFPSGGELPIPEEYMGACAVIVAKAEGDGYCDSEPQYLDIPERPLPPEGVRGVDASSAEAEDGKLTGVTDDMEYTTGDEAWQMITDEEVTDLPPGVYLVRYQGDYNYFAGKAVEIRIGVDGEEPDPTPGKPQPAPSDDDDGENTGASSAPSSNPTSKPSEMETKAFPFTDVRREAWYYGAVEEACAKGLMRGMSDTLFEPEKPLTRGEAVTVLYRLEGSPAVSGSVFGDIPAGHFSAGAVAWATREGLVKGFVDGTFRPNTDVTREQLATILWRYAMWKGWDVTVEGELSGYMDLDQISSFALPAMKWASRTGLISGTDWGGLAPQTETSRGEAAAIFVRQSKR